MVSVLDRETSGARLYVPRWEDGARDESTCERSSLVVDARGRTRRYDYVVRLYEHHFPIDLAVKYPERVSDADLLLLQ
jgi:hypothetical protein